MALPTLTAEQRQQALDKAAEARKIRAEFKTRLGSGELTPTEGLDTALGDTTLAKMKLTEFLTSLPGWGKVKATNFLETNGVLETRKLRGLGARQLDGVRDAIGS